MIDEMVRGVRLAGAQERSSVKMSRVMGSGIESPIALCVKHGRAMQLCVETGPYERGQPCLDVVSCGPACFALHVCVLRSLIRMRQRSLRGVNQE